MDEHTPGLQRKLSDATLRMMTIEALYRLSYMCEVEPADPTICDACAAYLIAHEKDRTAKGEPWDFGPEDCLMIVQATSDGVQITRMNDEVTEARFHLAWLMWCFSEGYVTPEDREIMTNWLLGDTQALSTEDRALRDNLLYAADEVLAALEADRG